MFKRKKIDSDLIKESGTTSEDKWSSRDNEGELAIDAYETDKEFVVQSTIAGISAKDLDISVEDDMLTIRGKREKPINNENRNYLHQECFWGPFSKRIILPEKVKITQAKATVKNGILTLKIPKASSTTTKKISVQDK